MSRRPRLLDLFCGAGGAAVGYHRAGFEVVGVDNRPQPHYPFEFHLDDAMTVLAAVPARIGGVEFWPLGRFDAIHASPPCQAFTQMSARWRGKGGKADGHVDLLTPTRAMLADVSLPWVIENVQGARNFMRTTLALHGGQFGLGVHRPRLFESNVMLMSPGGPRAESPIGVYGDKPDGRMLWRLRNNGNMKGKSVIRAARSIEEARAVMGIDWMPEWDELREAIPPAYTEWIGRQLLAAIRVAA